VKLDNPLLVRREYASEERLAKRNAVPRSLSQGRNLEDAAFEAVAELKPARMVDIGCGLGEMAERVQRELGTHVRALDVSPRMVELAKARGLDAQIGDAEHLPFPDADFACAFAGDVDAELVFPDTESIRTFVASTIDRAHLAQRVPEVDGRFRAAARHVVFVAKGPR
jgi:SAM-dependent methyltransferase